MTTPGSVALILGATGATGSHVLRELLASSHFTKVVEAGRRVTPAEKIQDIPGKTKLIQKTLDLENTTLEDLKAHFSGENVDVVYITLGTTRAKAGSAENWVKIDREIPLKAAEAAKRDDGKPQRLVYLSAAGANSSSFFPYLQSKGLTEHGFAKLGYSDFITFRPGMLREAERPETRLMEGVASVVTGLLSRFTPTLEISVKTLAKSIALAGTVGTAGLPASAEATTQPATKDVPAFTAIGNKGALFMAQNA